MRADAVDRILHSLWLCLFCILIVSPVWSADDFPEPVRLMIEKAVTKDDGAHLLPTVQIAADVVPESAAEILAIVTAAAPARAAEVAVVLGLPPPQFREQVVAEASAIEPPPSAGFFSPSTWDGRVEIGGTLNTGNTDEKAISAGLELVRQTDLWLFELKTAFYFQSSNGTTNKQRFAVDTQINRTINDRLYAFANVGYIDDQFSGFDYRITTAGGLGYYVFKGEPIEWRVEAGPAVRIDKPSTANQVDVDPAGIARSKFNWIITESAALLNETTVIVDGGMTVDNLIALDLAITEALKARLSYAIRYNDSPPVGTQGLDTTTKASVLYEF